MRQLFFAVLRRGGLSRSCDPHSYGVFRRAEANRRRVRLLPVCSGEQGLAGGVGLLLGSPPGKEDSLELKHAIHAYPLKT